MTSTALESSVGSRESESSLGLRHSPHTVARDVTIEPIVGMGGAYVMTNCYLVGNRERWMMVDTGVPDTHQRTLNLAEQMFADRPPVAIVLTHAHFDHYGSAKALSEAWDVPIYIHSLDLPYVTGRDSLPPYDPTVGGFVSQLSRMFPISGTDLGHCVQTLPEDGRIPGMEDWRWVPTPGHTPGHISLFRESDRTLLAGDALITVDQDSVVDALLIRQSLHGPSTFATYDWPAAKASVQRLAELEPETICTGHGEPMSGPEMPSLLRQLAADFGLREVPRQGRYVGQPIRADEQGIQSVPEAPFDTVPIYAALACGALAATAIAALTRPRVQRSHPFAAISKIGKTRSVQSRRVR